MLLHGDDSSFSIWKVAFMSDLPLFSSSSKTTVEFKISKLFPLLLAALKLKVLLRLELCVSTVSRMDTGRSGDLRGRVNVRVSIIFSDLSSKRKKLIYLSSKICQLFHVKFDFEFFEFLQALWGH